LFPFLAKHKKKVAEFAYIIYDGSFLIELRASKKVSGANHLPQNEASSSSHTLMSFTITSQKYNFACKTNILAFSSH
ncbi:hypothetical protein VIGAN_05046600, partial [Vigna angularis var. angularis]